MEDNKIENIISGIERKNNRLMDERRHHLDSLITRLIESPQADLTEIIMFGKRYPEPIEDLPPINALISVIHALQAVLEDKETPVIVKDMFSVIYGITASEIGGKTRDFTEKQMNWRESLFVRRDDLPRESIFRRNFVEAYIDEEVYNRFYLNKAKEAGTYGTEEEEESYSPEKAKEWDNYFNQLCREYGEEQYIRAYNSPEEYYKAVKPTDRLTNKNEIKFIREAIEKSIMLTEEQKKDFYKITG